MTLELVHGIQSEMKPYLFSIKLKIWNFEEGQSINRYTILTQKSASLELAPPFWHEIFSECLPRMSAPLFSQKEHSFEKQFLKGRSFGNYIKKYNAANFVKNNCLQHVNIFNKNIY